MLPSCFLNGLSFIWESTRNWQNLFNALIICGEHLPHLTNKIAVQETAHSLSIGSDIRGIHTAILCIFPAFKGLPITVIGLTDDAVWHSINNELGPFVGCLAFLGLKLPLNVKSIWLSLEQLYMCKCICVCLPLFPLSFCSPSPLFYFVSYFLFPSSSITTTTSINDAVFV